MKTFLLVVILSGLATASQAAGVPPGQNIASSPITGADNPLGHPSALPSLPEGRRTILGGEIRNFDPVRDQFSLQIYGQRPMKILFDERTQVYRDGVKIPVRDLGPEDHASVQTTLDGANVFAVSIHILSGSPEGECDGRVLRFNPNTGELAVVSAMSPEPVKLSVTANASIARVGEPEFTKASSGLSDLVPGTLVSASFESDATRRNVAREIKVLAVPGAAFAFSGKISFIDMHTGTMVLNDPRDGKSYQIHFDSARFATSEALRPDANVTVTATYDGTRYAANAITMN